MDQPAATSAVIPQASVLFEQLPDAVYLIDPATSAIVWCNRAGWHSLGLTPEQVLHHSVLSLQIDVTGGTLAVGLSADRYYFDQSSLGLVSANLRWSRPF